MSLSLYDHLSPCSDIIKDLFNSIKITFQALIWNFPSTFVMVSFNCQSGTIYSNLGGDSGSSWSVCISVGGCLDYITWGRKTHPLWVAPFPRQEILNSIIGEGEFSINVHVLTYCPVLLNMDRMWLVALFASLLLSLLLSLMIKNLELWDK